MRLLNSRYHGRRATRKLISGVQAEIGLTRSGHWRWVPDASDSRQYLAFANGHVCRWIRNDNGKISLGCQHPVVENTYASQLLTRNNADGRRLDEALDILWREVLAQ
jgi:hypothetical protein